MKTYPLHVTFNIYSDELGPEDRTQFSKVIPIPFVPYLLENKTIHIYFKDSSGRETELPVECGEISWTINGTKFGYWGMRVDMHPIRYCGKHYIEVLTRDIRFFFQ